MKGIKTDRIEMVRWKMIQSGVRFGLSSPATLQLSEELDALINVQQLNEISKTKPLDKKIIQ
ncbi:aspartyl-phosphate phosphatase Spo0E family protein [Rossellomorea sp. AcN35-11]|nr:aspartyl-phosphate phosphatase Spo0E family protein [Rossellomorea aquimaris]NMH71402.1 aspartyl-phosphate phosphatase Spo0E family protein [Bacillus sp. RO3]WJV29106.1 aspartyl-phosphate phosphatase Spo0E family protein [Rossellomorea sp. AcN35-11]